MYLEGLWLEMSAAYLGTQEASLACDEVSVHLGCDVCIIHGHQSIGMVEICRDD